MNLMAEKNNLTAQELNLFNSEYDKRKKSTLITWLLWWFAGVFAGHRFYLGQTGYAIAMLLCGWMTLFIWNLVDAFFISKNLNLVNEKVEEQILIEIKAFRRDAPTV